MNRLLIDMGNQRLKWALVEGAELSEANERFGVLNVASLAIDESVGAGSASIWTLPRPTEVWVSSVSASAATAALADLCDKRWELSPRFVESGSRFGTLINGYDSPTQLGVDRWLAAIGAWATYCDDGEEPGVIVVDAGTAVTVDLVINNRFEGGSILPGIRLATSTLGRSTGRIRLSPDLAIGGTESHHPAMDSASETAWGGSNSDAAVAAGAVAAVCGGVRCCIDAIDRYIDSDAKVSAVLPIVVSGGDADIVARHLGETWIDRALAVQPDLVLAGLARVAADAGEREQAAE